MISQAEASTALQAYSFNEIALVKRSINYAITPQDHLVAALYLIYVKHATLGTAPDESDNDYNNLLKELVRSCNNETLFTTIHRITFYIAVVEGYNLRAIFAQEQNKAQAKKEITKIINADIQNERNAEFLYSLNFVAWIIYIFIACISFRLTTPAIVGLIAIISQYKLMRWSRGRGLEIALAATLLIISMVFISSDLIQGFAKLKQFK